MKKIVSIVLLSVFLVLFGAFSVFAKEPASVVISSVPDAKAGDTVTVTISVKDCPVASSIAIIPRYDNSSLEFVGGKWLLSDALISDTKFDPASSIIYAVATDINGDIMSLTFRIKDGISSKNLSVSCTIVIKSGSTAITTSVQAGTIAVACSHANTTNIAAVPATCKDTGFTAGVYCNDCDTYISGHEVIPKTDSHTYGSYVKVDAVNHKRVCSVCGNVETEEHEWDNGTVTLQPTHTAFGEKMHSCLHCSATKTEQVAKLTKHTYDMKNTEARYLKSAATCQQKAAYYYSCVCGEKGAATFEYGTFASHNYGSWIPEVSATCTKAGTKGHYECSVCHKYFDTEKKEVNDLTLSKLSHTYNQKKADAKYAKSAATCTQKAVYYYSCICGEKGAATFEYGELAAHTYKAEWSSDKTNHWHECSACGNKKEQAAHADGNKDHKCDICGIRMSECADANKDHKCDICGKKLSDHTGGTATCKEKATCTLCGQKYGEFASHTLKSNEAVAATCKSKGNIAYWTCTVCDKYFSDSAAATEISKDAISTPFNSENHMGGVRLENKKEPTCGTDGYTGDTYCNGCDAKLVGGEVIKATGNHIFKSEWSNDDTRHWHDCTVCGNAKSDKSEHEDGNKDHTCDICGAKYSNHTGGTATCTEKAICAICGEKYGDFARHSWSEWKTDADGKRTKECSACGKVANFMYGDFNYDGKVNTIDLTIMRKYLAGYDVEFDTAAADFNSDGKVSTVDLTTLRKYLAGYDVVLDGNSQKMKSIYKAKAFSVGVGELLLRSLFAIGSRH